ncbi:PAS domain S-box protein [Methanoculleus caldifontis]|uniref:PAS domain S-box protein n=1 Tax=Methanoculleus caldifontis TaxID=2651577 RepID=UPI002936E749|nr:PAS domain S-box protein [Methanoculleus sp. Wushi-C6]
MLSALAVLDALGEGALLIDRTDRVAGVNRPLEHLLGIDKDAFCSSDIDRFVHRYLTPRVTDGESTAGIVALLSNRHDVAGLACTIRTAGNQERRFSISSNGIREGLLRGTRVVRLQDITELKRTEEELLESRKKYRTIFDSLDSGFCIIEMIFDPGGRPVDYRFQETNRAFERLTGLSDVVGKTMRELAPGHEERWFEIFGAVARTGEARRFVQTAKFLKEGWYEVYAFPFEGPDGNRVAVLFDDITDRKQAEDRLRESEEKFRQVFESMGAGFVILEAVYGDKEQPADFIILDVDPAYESITGSKRDQVIGRRVSEVAPGIGRNWVERCTEGLGADRPVRFEEYNSIRDRWYGIHAGPIPGKDRCAFIFTDITDRKHTEEALRKNEELLRTIIEHSRDGINMLDLKTGRYIFISPSLAEITGFSAEEIDNISAEEVFSRVHPADREIAITQQEVLAAGLEPSSIVEYRWKVKSGEYHWFSDSRKVVLDERGHPVALVGIIRDVTDRRRAEGALRESEEKFRALVEHSLDGTLILDPMGKILFANHAAARLVGIKDPGEAIGRRNVMEFIAPESQGDAIKDFGEVAKGIDAFIARYKVLTVAGAERWFESIGKSIVFEGAPAILISLRDITERQRVEEAIRQSEEKYRTLFDSASDIIIIHDLDGKFLDANRVATERLGYSREELLTMNLSMIVTPEFAALVPERIGEVVEKGHTVFETADVTRKGRHIPAEVSARLISYQGRPAVLSIVRDITERKRAEEAVRQSEERFRLLTENASDIVVVLDHEGRIRYASPSVKTVGGYAPKDLIGRSVLELTHPDDLALVLDALRTATAHPKGRVTLEVRIRHASGYWSYLEVTGANLLREPAVRGLLVNARDITDRKKAEEALVRRTDDLIRANREVEAARDEANVYLDIMTHDVRNANNVSSMYADLLMDLSEGNLKTYAEKLHASIDRSSEILMNVATIRRASEEPGNLVPVNLDAVIQSEIAGFPDAAIRYRGTRVEVLADGLLPTVFTNLIGNAVKFGGPDVEIVVRVEEQDGEVLVSVEDTGPGIQDEVKGKLFTRFERGMARGRGQGLGLFIVRTLVERYGGRVRVEDRIPGHPECGAAFRFTLKKAA